MHGSISVVGWKAANEIAMHLLENGYEVLITCDGEKIHQLDFKGELHLSYTVAFAHPKYDDAYFELVDEFEGTRSWEDIKEELKVTGDYPADIAEGLEHLDKECEDCKVKPKKEKK